MGYGPVAKILSLTALRALALEKLAITPKNFGKFRKNFFGGGPPRKTWGQNLWGRPQVRPRWMQKKSDCKPLTQSEKVKKRLEILGSEPGPQVKYFS